MAAPSTRLQSLVNNRYVPSAVDQLINYSGVSCRLFGNAMKWSGARLQRAIKYRTTGLGGTFIGLEEFSTQDVHTSIKLTYDLGGYEQPVVVPGMENLISKISSETATPLIGYKVDEAKIELIDGMAEILYGNNDSVFNSIRDFADDGGQTTSIGGQTRSTYSVLNGTDTAAATYSLDVNRTLIAAVSSEGVGRHEPTLQATTPTVWNLIEQLFTPTIRANYQMTGYPIVTMKSKAPVKGLAGGMGFRSLVFAGVPIVADEKCTSGTLYMINEHWLDWYGANDPEMQKVDLGKSKKGLENVYADSPSQFHGFNWEDLMRSTNQYGKVGHFYLFGQLVSWQPRRQGCNTGITGI